MQATETYVYTTDPCDANTLAAWLREGRNVCVWNNVAIGDPGAQQVCTPEVDAEGNKLASPHWKYGKTPAHVIKTTEEIGVYVYEVLATSRTKNRGGLESQRKKLARKYNGDVYFILLPGADTGKHAAEFRKDTGVISLTEWLNQQQKEKQ